MIKSAIAAYWVMWCPATPLKACGLHLFRLLCHMVSLGDYHLYGTIKSYLSLSIYLWPLNSHMQTGDYTGVPGLNLPPARFPKPHPSYLVRSTWGFLMPYKSPTASCKTLPHTYPNLLCASRYNIHEFQLTAACIREKLCKPCTYAKPYVPVAMNSRVMMRSRTLLVTHRRSCMNGISYFAAFLTVDLKFGLSCGWYDVHFNINAWNFTIISPPIDRSAQLSIYMHNYSNSLCCLSQMMIVYFCGTCLA